METKPSLLHRSSIALLAVGLVGLVTFHFVATILYLLPLNPVRLAMGPGVTNYISPYFRQRWALFAPDPPLDNKILMLRCRLQGTEGVEETKWHVLDHIVSKARRSNLFSPVERVARVDRAVLAAALGSKDEISDLFSQKLKKKFPDALPDPATATTDEERRYAEAAKTLTEHKKDQLEQMRPYVDRVGSSYCETFHGKGRVLASQFRIVLHQFPRYSERAQKDDFGDKKAVMLPWGDFVPGIAPLRI